MKAFYALIAFACLVLVAPTAFAEPPTAPAGDLALVASRTPESPKMLERLVRGADEKIVKKLEMVLYKNKESGQQATFKVTPSLNPGCKFGLILNF